MMKNFTNQGWVKTVAVVMVAAFLCADITRAAGGNFKGMSLRKQQGYHEVKEEPLKVFNRKTPHYKETSGWIKILALLAAFGLAGVLFKPVQAQQIRPVPKEWPGIEAQVKVSVERLKTIKRILQDRGSERHQAAIQELRGLVVNNSISGRQAMDIIASIGDKDGFWRESSPVSSWAVKFNHDMIANLTYLEVSKWPKSAQEKFKDFLKYLAEDGKVNGDDDYLASRLYDKWLEEAEEQSGEWIDKKIGSWQIKNKGVKSISYGADGIIFVDLDLDPDADKTQGRIFLDVTDMDLNGRKIVIEADVPKKYIGSSWWMNGISVWLWSCDSMDDLNKDILGFRAKLTDLKAGKNYLSFIPEEEWIGSKQFLEIVFEHFKLVPFRGRISIKVKFIESKTGSLPDGAALKPEPVQLEEAGSSILSKKIYHPKLALQELASSI